MTELEFAKYLMDHNIPVSEEGEYDDGSYKYDTADDEEADRKWYGDNNG